MQQIGLFDYDNMVQKLAMYAQDTEWYRTSDTLKCRAVYNARSGYEPSVLWDIAVWLCAYGDKPSLTKEQLKPLCDELRRAGLQETYKMVLKS